MRICHRRVHLDIGDPRLVGKPFAGSPRFVCQYFVQRWSASPGRTCLAFACITIYPPADKRARILYCSPRCGTCEPVWHIDQAQRDDPIWAPLNDKREPCPFRCSNCGARAEILTDVPAGFALTPMAPRPPKPTPPEKEPTPPLGPWHTPSF